MARVKISRPILQSFPRLARRTIEVVAQSQRGVDPAVAVAISQIQKTISDLQRQIATAAAVNEDSGFGTLESAILILTNRSGGSLDQGRVVVRDTANDESFTTTTTERDINIIGSLWSESIADDAEGSIIACGLASIYCDADAAAISRGDFLISDSVAGRAKKTSPNDLHGAFGIALEALASGQGDIAAFIFPRVIDAGRIDSVTEIDNTDSPYTVLASDVYIRADSAGGAVTINLQAASARNGKPLTIKDTGGAAPSNNITVNAYNAGDGTEDVDGEYSLVFAIEYMSLTLQPRASGYDII